MNIKRLLPFAALAIAWCLVCAPAQAKVAMCAEKNALWGKILEASGRNLSDALPSPDFAMESECYGYETAMGRACWPSPDPIGEDGGENLYVFLNDDSINESDYLGLDYIAAGRRRFSVIPGLPKWSSPATHLFIAKYNGCASKDDEWKEFSKSDFDKRFGSDQAVDGFDLQPTKSSADRVPRVWITEVFQNISGKGFTQRKVHVAVMISVIRHSGINGAGRVDDPAAERFQILFTGSKEDVAQRWKKVSASADSYQYAEHGWSFSNDVPVIPPNSLLIRNWPYSNYEWSGNNSNTFGRWLGEFAGHTVTLGGIGNKTPNPPTIYKGTTIDISPP